MSFRRPYLLYVLLALSGLHMLHRGSSTDSDLYHLASNHNFAAMRLARPRVTRSDAEHRDAVFNFAAFSSLFAIAEPPLRNRAAAIKTPSEAITSLLHAFKMARGILAVQTPFMDELRASCSVKPELWEDNRDDVIPSLEINYPQITSLRTFMKEHCSDRQLPPCQEALRELFISVGVLASNHKNPSSLRLIMT